MKRNAISLIGLILLGFLLISCSKSTPTFEKAVRDPSIRQSYIQKILEQHPAPAPVKKVLYATPEVLEELKRVHQFTPQESDLMTTNPIEEISHLEIGTRELPARISVFPAAFSTLYVQNEQDFASSLLHEYDHVWQLNSTNIAGFTYTEDFRIVAGQYKGENSITLIKIVMELDAFRKEIDRVTQKNWGSSQSYIDIRYGLYMDNYLDLLEYFEEGPPADPQIKKRMIIKFFAPWIPRTSLASLTKSGQLQLTNPVTGKSYILPEEVLSIQESR